MNKYEGIKKLNCVEKVNDIVKNKPTKNKKQNSLFIRIVVGSCVLICLIGIKFINNPLTNKVLFEIKDVVCTDFIEFIDKDK